MPTSAVATPGVERVNWMALVVTASVRNPGNAAATFCGNPEIERRLAQRPDWPLR